MSEREWGFYLDDMIKCCEKVLFYTERLDQDGFETDEKTYDATLRKLELLGEVATHIPETLCQPSHLSPPALLQTQLIALGQQIRAHRKALRISATTAAEAAGMSRVTLHRIEKGAPVVTMGAYVNSTLCFPEGPSLPRPFVVPTLIQLAAL